jgi:ketosteroid isomerase-like protein
MAGTQTDHIVKEVKGVYDKITAYSEGAELGSFLSCYDDSPTFLHISSDGQMRDHEGFKKIVSEYYNSLREQKITTLQEKLYLIDNDFVIVKNGDSMIMNNYSITSVFKKIENKWKVIHSHESALPPEIIKKSMPELNQAD